MNLEENSASSADTEDDINLPEDESLYEEEILSTTDSSKPPQNVVWCQYVISGHKKNPRQEIFM